MVFQKYQIYTDKTLKFFHYLSYAKESKIYHVSSNILYSVLYSIWQLFTFKGIYGTFLNWNLGFHRYVCCIFLIYICSTSEVLPELQQIYKMENNFETIAIDYCCKALYLGYLKWSWLRLCSFIFYIIRYA